MTGKNLMVGFVFTACCGLFVASSRASIMTLDIANPSFEDAYSSGDGLGGTFGWTHSPSPGPNGLGAVTVTAPDPSLTPPGAAHDGTYFMWGRGVTGPTVSPAILLQRLDVSLYQSEVDAGLVFTSFTAYGLGDDTNNDGVGDWARMRLTFYDDVTGGSVLGSPLSSNIGIANSWTAMTLDSIDVPTGTRSFEIALFVDRPWGSYNDAGFDNISGSLDIIPAPSSLTCMAGLFAMAFVVSWCRRRKRA